MPPEDAEQEGAIRAVSTAFDLLDYLAACPGDAGVLEMSRAVGVNQTTVHRVLTTLKQRGAVVQDPGTRRYRLGYGLLALGHRAAEKTSALAVVLPHMRALSEQTRETAALCVLSGWERVYVGEVRSPEPVHYAVEIGRPFPLYLGSPGKAILAFLPAPTQEAVIRLAERAGQPVDRLRMQFQEVRRTGVLFSAGERVRGSAAFAAPLFGHDGKITGSLVLAGPASRLRQADTRTAGRLVAAAAGVVSRELGARTEADAGAATERRTGS